MCWSSESQRGPSVVKIFRSGVCFDAPSHIPYLFVAREVNKINNVNIVYWLKSKYPVYACYTVKIYKNKPVKFSKTEGGGGGGVRPGSPF